MNENRVNIDVGIKGIFQRIHDMKENTGKGMDDVLAQMNNEIEELRKYAVTMRDELLKRHPPKLDWDYYTSANENERNNNNVPERTHPRRIRFWNVTVEEEGDEIFGGDLDNNRLKMLRIRSRKNGGHPIIIYDGNRSEIKLIIQNEKFFEVDESETDWFGDKEDKKMFSGLGALFG